MSSSLFIFFSFSIQSSEARIAIQIEMYIIIRFLFFLQKQQICTMNRNTIRFTTTILFSCSFAFLHYNVNSVRMRFSNEMENPISILFLLLVFHYCRFHCPYKMCKNGTWTLNIEHTRMKSVKPDTGMRHDSAVYNKAWAMLNNSNSNKNEANQFIFVW